VDRNGRCSWQRRTSAPQRIIAIGVMGGAHRICVKLSGAWKAGADPCVPATGQAKKVAMLGSFDHATRRLIVHTSPTKRSSDFVTHLEQLDRLYGPRPCHPIKPSYGARPAPSAPAVSYPSTPSWPCPARRVDVCSSAWRACWLVPTLCLIVWRIWSVNATAGTRRGRRSTMSQASALRCGTLASAGPFTRRSGASSAFRLF
jgi:hypothetical protein